MKTKTTSILWICIAVTVCSLLMALVDGIWQPQYMIKSAVKACLFLLIPLLLAFPMQLNLGDAFRPDKWALITGLCLGGATFGILLGAYALLGQCLDLSAVPAALAQNGGINKDNFLFVSLYIAFCNSVLEEFFFRNFAFLGLWKTHGKWLAFLFSAGAFAVYHAGMLITMIPFGLFLLTLFALFGCGLLFNALDCKTKRIWVSWFVHIGANLAINLIGMQLLK